MTRLRAVDGIDPMADEKPPTIETPIKFEGAAQERFLAHYAQHGRVTHAADAAGVTRQCVDKHRKADPEFESKVQAAKAAFADRFMEHYDSVCFMGMKHTTYRDGEIASENVRFPESMLIARAKSVNPDMRERQEHDINVRGGVLVVPAVQGSDEWESAVATAAADGAKPTDGGDGK